MEKQYLSIKMMADKLGTSKQRVYRCIKKNCIKEAHHEVVNGNSVLFYDEETFKKIKELLNVSKSDKNDEAHQETRDDTHEAHQETLYDILVKQLEEKDKQIEKLQKALDEERQLVAQAQHLHAMDKQRILELEDKMAVAEVEPEPEQNQGKKRWWNIFRG